MGSPKIPASPDMGAANREAISADVSTLPTRNLIDQAAQLGKSVVYTDPSTGKQMTADFTGLGQSALMEQAAALANQYNADSQRQQLALRQELGLANAEQTSKEVAAADPLAYQTRQELTGRILGDLNTPASKIDESQSIYDAATRLGAIDPTTGALNYGLQEAMRDYNTPGFSEATQRELNNQIRSGQVARGNFLGDAAAVAEASQQGQAMDQLRQARLGQLLTAQGQAFGQNQAMNQANLQGAQALSSDQRQVENTNYARNQQNLANASAMVLGQPITNQFGSLQGAQSGAVGFNQAPAVNVGQINQSGAGQNYDAQMKAWQTKAGIAAQGNPWMGVAGSAAGAAAGYAVAAMV